MKHGVELYEVLGWPGPVTHRQFEAYSAWESLQWNRPDRSDWYAMQTAFNIACSNAKDPRSVKFERMKLNFRDGTKAPSMSKETAAKYAKAASLARLGAARVRLPDGRIVSAREVIRGELERADEDQVNGESQDS